MIALAFAYTKFPGLKQVEVQGDGRSVVLGWVKGWDGCGSKVRAGPQNRSGKPGPVTL